MDATDGVGRGMVVALIGGAIGGVVIQSNFLFAVIIFYFAVGISGIIILMGFADTLTDIQSQAQRSTELLEFLTDKLDEE